MVQRRKEGMELSRNIQARGVDGSYTKRANVDSVSAASMRRREVQKGTKTSADCGLSETSRSGMTMTKALAARVYDPSIEQKHSVMGAVTFMKNETTDAVEFG